MFRLWCKLYDDNGRLLKDSVEENGEDINRTGKVLDAVRNACREFDLAEPIWLEANIKDFKAHSKTRFRKDNFMESVPFEYMEIQVIEED